MTIVTNTNGNGATTIAATPMALQYAIDDLSQRFGNLAVMRLGGEQLPRFQAQAISTGFAGLDAALGIGGVPRGRITDIYGPDSSGKSTLCLHIIAQAQKKGGACLYIDTEHALEPVYAAHCGVRLDDLYVAQPDTAEEALEIAEAMVRVGIDVVVIDSAAALAPRAELEGEMGDHHPRLHGALMSQALRKLVGAIRKNNTAFIFTNQLRQKTNVLFGSPEVPTGGMALRFYAAVRIDLRRIKMMKADGEIIGSHIRATVKKNKVAPPLRSAEFTLYHPQR
jgi:recombination protein RecA